VLQKSIREGFGLTVTEATWKGAPVIGGNVGGILRQIRDGENGPIYIIAQRYNLGRSAVIIQKMVRPSIRLRCELRCRSGASSPKMSRPDNLGGALSTRS
jgi:trehalose synthase